MLGLQIDTREAYDRFVRRVIVSGVVWHLEDKGRVAFCLSNDCEDEETEEELDVLLFWSDEAYARRCAVDEWADYQPKSTSLSEFLDAWLVNIDKQNALVGPNWNGHLIGKEIEPLELQERIRRELSA